MPLGVFERVRNDLRGERDKRYASVSEDRWAGPFVDPSPTIYVGAYNAAPLLDGNFGLPPDVFVLVPSVGTYELNEGTSHVETDAALALYVHLVLGSDLALQLAIAKVEVDMFVGLPRPHQPVVCAVRAAEADECPRKFDEPMNFDNTYGVSRCARSIYRSRSISFPLRAAPVYPMSDMQFSELIIIPGAPS